jgi:hypothetical protein
MTNEETVKLLKALRKQLEEKPACGIDTDLTSDFVLLDSPISYSVEREGTLHLINYLIGEVE